MPRHTRESGAALIMLLGMIAALAIIAATLVMVIVNQQGATAGDRWRKTTLYYAEAALDNAVTVAKAKDISQTSEWLTPAEIADAFGPASFPPDATVTYRVYDNLATVNYDIKWDSNRDGTVWIETTVTYLGKTTRMRVLMRQTTEMVITAFPKAVLFSDTTINASSGTSDIYAVNAGTTTPYTSGLPYPTDVMSGGNFVGNSTMNLAAPSATVQSVGIIVNGTVTTPGHNFSPRFGGVGLLSDYFDQAAQADLGDEAQSGQSHASAPAAPTAPTPTPTATPSSAVLSTMQSTTSTTTYTAPNDWKVSGNLTLSRGTNTTGRTFNFQRLYVTGNLTLTGPVTVNTTSLQVGGTLTINNTTTRAVTDTFGPLYVVGSLSKAGRVAVNATSVYVGGATNTINTTTTTAVTDTFGLLYVVGSLTKSNNVAVQAPSVYVGGSFAISGTPGVTDQFGLLYVVGDFSVSGNNTVRSTALVANNFTISGATSAVTDQFGPIYAGGNVTWSGTASVKTTDYTDASKKPGPMWIGSVFSASGTFNHVFGPTWITGNAGTSDVAVRFTGPTSGTTPCTVLCPLLATTEKTVTSGRVDFGTRTTPMIYYMQCDNDGLYTNTCEWGSTGTFYGLMVIMEAPIVVSNGNGVQPNIVGSLFCGTPVTTDITLNNASSLCYDQAVIDAVKNCSITTTTTVTTTVPGSWQQLSAH